MLNPHSIYKDSITLKKNRRTPEKFDPGGYKISITYPIKIIGIKHYSDDKEGKKVNIGKIGFIKFNKINRQTFDFEVNSVLVKHHDLKIYPYVNENHLLKCTGKSYTRSKNTSHIICETGQQVNGFVSLYVDKSNSYICEMKTEVSYK